MDIDCIPFKTTGYFSSLICDYIDGKPALKPFYNRLPTPKNFKAQLEEKAECFPHSHRAVLQQALLRQYEKTNTSERTQDNINLLSDSNTFTITTGHQLNLFTGPLYFLYKIISTINLTEQLKAAYPEQNFVPVYWMATEDHDFDEINYFNLNGKKLQWNTDANGAVGRLKTAGLQNVYDVLEAEIGSNDNAKTLKALFTKAYLEHDTLTEATRFLANELFGSYGLVILDGDDSDLKRLLIPYAKKDIFDKLAFKKVSATILDLEGLNAQYGVQVNPRKINYFYLTDNIRERLIERDGNYFVNDTDISFTRVELLDELENHPERFSPNVIARPLYQEVVLPNLCYIGGGGEIAYWLELKTMFEAMQIPFPMLLLRNSALVLTEKQHRKLKKLNLSIEHLFLKQHSFINKKIREISNIEIDFSPQKKHLEKQFADLYKLAEQTDKSFLGAVKAQEVKQKKGLDKLEKRLLKAQKRKLKDHVVRLTELQNALFPNQSLQERHKNFSELYVELGDELIPMLINTLKPLKTEFFILKY